jgi:hypothetical protein
MALATSAPSGPRSRLAGVNVRSILCRKYAVVFDGTDQPHYKTTFMEGGVCKTEWLEAKELPGKKLADFEVALDEEEEEEEEADIRAAKRLLLLTSPSLTTWTRTTTTMMTTVRTTARTVTTGTSSPTETKSRGSVPSESDMT